jgi:hypothetical protein
MRTLLEMGYTDFNRNEELVRKHNGNINNIFAELFN